MYARVKSFDNTHFTIGYVLLPDMRLRKRNGVIYGQSSCKPKAVLIWALQSLRYELVSDKIATRSC